MQAKRGPGRPRKTDYDEKGNLKPMERDIPEEEPEVANEVASQSAGLDLEALKAELRAELLKEVRTSAPAQKGPDGVWRRNYREEHLLVHGGVEVEHPNGFRPLPPSGIPMYEAVGGGTTNNLEQIYRFLPAFDELGHVKMDDNGEPVGKKIPTGKVAKRDEAGNPVLTNEYKVWLHVRNQGGRLGSNVMSDMRAGRGIALNEEGVPVTV